MLVRSDSSNLVVRGRGPFATTVCGLCDVDMFFITFTLFFCPESGRDHQPLRAGNDVAGQRGPRGLLLTETGCLVSLWLNR